MSWTDLRNLVNAAAIQHLGGVDAVLLPQGGGSHTFSGIPTRPGMTDGSPPDFGPGAASLFLWVDFENLSPTPAQGDQVQYNGNTYVIANIDAEVTGGGAILKMRIC